MSLQRLNGSVTALQNVINHCRVEFNQPTSTLTLRSLVNDFTSFPATMDFSNAQITSPDRDLDIYHAEFKQNFCNPIHVNRRNAEVVNGEQSLIVNRTQGAPVITLRTTLTCSDGETTFVKEFSRVCDFGFVPSPGPY